MKRNIVWTMLFVVTLLLSMAAVALAKDGHRTCSDASAVGEWAFTWTGTLIINGAAAPAAAVGRSTFYANGTFSGTLTSSIGLLPVSQQETTTGTFTVKPDCTATLDVTIVGAVPRTATWDMVIDDNGSESRSIMTSLQIGAPPPVGPTVKPIVTMIAKKQFPGRSEQD